MFELPKAFYVYNKQYKKNFLIKYTNLEGAFIDENKVVHDIKVLNESKANLSSKIIEAGLF
jgi:hypothetical protein|tara:strand:+ start:259 stop:441 length:183 start_codon:yes stop_codon:yes gene_type:complete